MKLKPRIIFQAAVQKPLLRISEPFLKASQRDYQNISGDKPAFYTQQSHTENRFWCFDAYRRKA